MDAVAWAMGAIGFAVVAHFKYRSWMKGSALGAAFFSACAIFVWPIVRGREISNIRPIAMVFQFVCAFLVASMIDIPFALTRRN